MRKSIGATNPVQSKSPKVIRMERLQKEIDVWKARNSSLLEGNKPEYATFKGCYGNPEAKIVFIAEIASTAGWKRTGVDLKTVDLAKVNFTEDTAKILYTNLVRSKLIRDGEAAKSAPCTWKCWITDFIKSAEVDSIWKAKKLAEKRKILRKCAGFLIDELRIIKPNCIVFLGANAEKYFHTYVEREIKVVCKFSLRHYAYRRKKIVQNEYRNEIPRIAKFCKC